MNINGERLWRHLLSLGSIGKAEEGGGLRRFSFTEPEKDAKSFVRKLMEDAGLSVSEDGIGNLIGRKEGKDPEAKTLIIGSHLDTVQNGGIFDGALGVLAGIEVLHTLQDNGIETESAVEVIAFTDEEGARFSSGLLGSHAVAGELTEEHLNGLKDEAGKSLKEAMLDFGYDPSLLQTAKRDPGTIKAYLELHIEQGKLLETNHLSAGIVTAIVGVKWLSIKLTGEAGHAGTTPMYLRKDPLAAAGKIISFIEDLIVTYDQAVATVGRVNVIPGGINIIPAEVEFSIDLRDSSQVIMEEIEGKIRAYIENICLDREIFFEIEELHHLKPAQCSSNIIQAFEAGFENRKLESFQLVSGAAHDAMIMANITDMGMLFIRSQNGISHNPQEWSEKSDVIDGTNILLDSVLLLATGSMKS